MRRRFVDAPDNLRCTATVRVGKEKGRGADDFARCGRYAKVGTLCRQHAKKADTREKCPIRYAGGW